MMRLVIRYPPERPHRQCRTIGAAEQDAWGQGQAHTFLGMIAASTAGDRARAAAHYRAAVDFLRRSHDVTLLPVALIGQAGLLERRDPAVALEVVAAATAIRARAGGDFAPFYRARLEATRAVAEAALGADAQRVWEAGTRRGVDEAIALAFAFGGPANPGWRFVSVWDSQDALDRFVAERLLPAYEQLGLSYDAAERTLFTSTSSSPATSPGRRSRRDLRAPSRRGGPPVERTFA